MDSKTGGVGIGMLNEHSLHAFLKEYYEPDEIKREVKIGRFVADIADGSSIIEIQTRGFYNLKKKLAFFLKDHDVTVVYPVAFKKHIIWIEPETGEASKPRKSPKTGGQWEIFYELIHIKDMLCEPRLKFKVVLLDIDEYRKLDGWSMDRKKGSARIDRVPGKIHKEIEICSAADFVRLLPENLPPAFTTRDLQSCGKISRTLANRTVNVLKAVGAIRQIGKKGRNYLYKIYK